MSRRAHRIITPGKASTLRALLIALVRFSPLKTINARITKLISSWKTSTLINRWLVYVGGRIYLLSKQQMSKSE